MATLASRDQVTTQLDADLLWTEQGGVSKRIEFSDHAVEVMKDVHDQAAKGTLSDNDEYLINDSGAANVPKKVLQSVLSVEVMKDIDDQAEKTSLSSNDEFIINDSDAANVPKKVKLSTMLAELMPTGYYAIADIQDDGAGDIKLLKPKYRVANQLIEFTSDQTVTDAYTASRWYAIAAAESDGSLLSVDVTNNEFDNWTISGNQLDMYDQVYDTEKNYCRDSISSAYYRILSVQKRNSGNTGWDYIIPVPTIPFSLIEAYTTSSQSIATGSPPTIIVWDSVNVDLNSELNTGTGVITFKFAQHILGDYATTWQNYNWTNFKIVRSWLYKDTASFKQFVRYEFPTTNTHAFAMPGSIDLNVLSGTTSTVRIEHDQGVNVTLNNAAAENFVTLKGMR